MKRSTILLLFSIWLIAAVCFGQEINRHQPLMIYLFSSSTCEQCQQLKQEFLPRILKKFQGAVAYQHIPVDDPTAFKLQLMYEQAFDNKSDDSVKLFVGKQCLSGIKDIRSRLEMVISEELNQKSITITPRQILSQKNEYSSEQSLAKRFARFTPGVVILAGLIDGINPCAFITLVFFISVLSLLKKTKKEILLVGGVFALSVFLTYVLLGLGAFKLIKLASVNLGISRLISIIALILALGLAVFNLLDFLKYKHSHDPHELSLKLPKPIRKIINHLIRSKMQAKNLILGALVLGFLVSLLESMCTGQVYLPTIIYIFQQKKMLIKAFCYLILYNIMFIIPLLFVFGLAYAGISSMKINKFFSDNLALSKLLLAGVFFILAMVLVFSNTVWIR
jgi:cytochrome c biogenesis protein CcdA